MGMLPKMEGRGFEQDLIPNVGQFELPMVLLRDGSFTLNASRMFVAR